LDDTISCASCHVLSAGGTDNRYRSVGVNGGVGERECANGAQQRL